MDTTQILARLQAILENAMAARYLDNESIGGILTAFEQLQSMLLADVAKLDQQISEAIVMLTERDKLIASYRETIETQTRCYGLLSAELKRRLEDDHERRKLADEVRASNDKIDAVMFEIRGRPRWLGLEGQSAN